MNESKKKIAIIGSGISGLSAAWLLSQSAEVHLFEKDDRIGGHSNTQMVGDVPVDTGFIVFNPPNYPNLVNLFKKLDVETAPTNMGFSVSRNKGEFEYSGNGIGGLFAQKRNWFNPKFYKMVWDILRFYKNHKQIEASLDEETTLGELFKQYNFSENFVNDHIIPMSAAIWSTPADQMLNYPAKAYLNFCANHGLLQLKDRPQWYTVVGGSKQYVHKIIEPYKDNIHLNCAIKTIKRFDDKVVIVDRQSNEYEFDDVVLACHSDQALALLDEPTEQESALLSQFPYQRNRAILHTDESLMPIRKKAWAPWSYLYDKQSENICVSYWMNELQPLNTDQNIFVTLNPTHEPKSESIVASFLYDHPCFNEQTSINQKQLWSLQGKKRTWFCGAYFGFGFHEDGLQSGLAVAEQLGGAKRPWEFDESQSRITVHK